MSAPRLHLEGVARSVRLPDGSLLEILRRIDLTVHPGEYVGIVGRSGTGKSTLLNILGLLDRPTGGHMLWDGTPTARLSQRTASRIRGAQIGFVFQQFNLLPGRTALENVAHPLLDGTAAEVRTRKRRAREVLERLGLGERADQVPTRLSGGEQQRVAIAVCSLTLVVAMSTMAQDSLRASYEQMSGRAATLTLETEDPRLSADPAALRQAADPVLEEFSITRTTVLSQTQVLVTGRYGDEWAETLLIEPDHGTIFSTELVAGRWFAPGDEQNLAPAAVVNENVLADRGLTASDLPASIELAATEGAAPLTATVIGVTPGNQWEMREVRLLAGAPAAIALVQEPQQFSLQAWVPEEIADDLATQVSSRLSAMTGGTWSGYRSDAFAFGDDPLGVLRTILLAIAGLILFLGVMGLLNIALVSVQQRVREIGIRRSFGATGARVFFSVMMESVVATSLAGVVGIAVSVGAGALAGLLPAIVATRARIVDAIRA